ncbi:N,N-dimethylformamidase [Saccharothrix tamanrassetensis]|uniref:N,N-dimethylformamidase n=1 Tax=Saccharothrix tamanrassetensis TaxID=1051531 RepID=A0A841CAG2_9PSEU|nr:N,N-dimethylformamidase beta subunit family domain-containing protein [Saccharothrix tamanrassetensis]MBB5953970.1 N,N-dimethylformamidase [Saccharothrix tamanrassetensis]
MSPVDHTCAPVVGYTDRLNARPGERIAVHASASTPDARVRVLHIDHDGTAPVRTPVDIDLPDRVPVPHQDFDHGSYGLVPRPPALGEAVSFAVWVWPTAFHDSRAGLVSQGDAADGPYAELVLRADGTPEFAVRTHRGIVRVTGPVLRLRRWYLVVGGYDADGARLEVRPRDPLADESRSVTTTASAGPMVTGGAPMLFAARRVNGRLGGHFDGKLDGPTVFTEVRTDLDWLAADTRSAWHLGARAHWDLSEDIGGDTLLELVDGRHGTLHNHPQRGVTGHDWTGDVLDWRYADRGYSAVHFHSDDLADCGWDPVLEIALPEDLPSGCYAVELETSEGVDRLPFFVRPREPRAKLAFLVPTLSYLTYALEHVHQPFLPEDPAEVAAPFARDNLLHSPYDRHTDGSGVATASLRRPLLGVRDDHVFRHARAPHQYSEDLHLVGWLRRQGFAFDVVTDHDLHAEGLAALAGYRGVVTGSHPEYWTGSMLDAVTSYLYGGGKLGYLGGNGAYWVTAIHPAKPYLVEVRRGYAGVRMWESEPGELHLAATGEPGGLWQERGRAPHRLFGIGTTAAGLQTGGSYDLVGPHPLLDGITQPLGDFGVVLGGAAAFETDGIDPLLGSPPNTVLLGRAMLGDTYVSADTGPTTPHPFGDPVDRRRADLTLLHTPGGGAVFATGSIGWCGALSHDKDDNDVSRLTAAALRWFGVGPDTEDEPDAAAP